MKKVILATKGTAMSKRTVKFVMEGLASTVRFGFVKNRKNEFVTLEGFNVLYLGSKKSPRKFVSCDGYEGVVNANLLTDNCNVMYPLDKSGKHFSGMLSILSENIDRLDDSVVVTLEKDTKIIVINNSADYVNLCNRFGVNESCSKEEQAMLKQYGVEAITPVKWSEVARFCDGVLITQNAINECKSVDNTDVALSSKSLRGFKHQCLITFENTECVDSVGTYEYSDDVVDAVLGLVKERADKGKPKKSYLIAKLDASHLADFRDINDRRFSRLNFNFDNIEESDFVDVSENRMFRTFGVREEVVIGDETVEAELDTKDLGNFIILNGNVDGFDSDLRDEYHSLIEGAIRHGIYDKYTGKTYKVCVQSASQARVGKFYFTCLDVELVRNRMLYGYDFGKEVVISKMESRIALCTTSGTYLEEDGVPMDFSIHPIAIDDNKVNHTAKRKYSYPILINEDTKDLHKLLDLETLERLAPCQMATLKSLGDVQITEGLVKRLMPYIENGVIVKEAESELSLTPTDGQGTIEVIPALKIANKLTLITKKEMKFFIANYKGNIEDLNPKNTKADKKFKAGVRAKMMSIFNKIPTAFQIRHAGDKGLLVLFPHNAYGYKEEIVMCDSMRKYIPDASEVCTWEIANYNKRKKMTALLSYQFVQSCNFSAETLKAMVEKQLVNIEHGILTDYTKAIKFLGQLKHLQGGLDDTLTSKLTLALSVSDKFISDPKVKNLILGLMDKFITDLGTGRIPVEGDYFYICCDPRQMFRDKDGNYIQQPLKSGQNYLNGLETVCAGFRSPMIDSSEPVKLKTCNDESLWFMKDLMVLNPEDDTLPRAGGADCDGDTMLISTDKHLVNALPEGLPMLFDDGDTAEVKKYEPTEENRAEHFCRTAKSSQIGSITNHASCHRDMALHLLAKTGEINDVCAYRVKSLRFLQGWEIDSAKTGKQVVLHEAYEATYTPHWLYFQKVRINFDSIEDAKAGITHQDKLRKAYNKYVGITGIQNRKLNDIGKPGYITVNGVVDKLSSDETQAKGKKVYTSQSPLGQLFDYVIRRYAQIRLNITSNETNELFKTFTKATSASYVKYNPDVRAIKVQYTKLYANVMHKKFSADQTENADERNKALITLNDNTRCKLLSLMSSEDDIFDLVTSCYDADVTDVSNTFMTWNCFYEEMLELASVVSTGFNLVSIPNYVEGSKVVVDNLGYMFAENGRMVSECELPLGVYDINIVDDRKFVKVVDNSDRFALASDEIKERLAGNSQYSDVEDCKTYSVLLSGFKQNNFNINKLVELFNNDTTLRCLEDSVSKKTGLGVYLNGSKVGSLSIGTSAMNKGMSIGMAVKFLKNTDFKIVSIDSEKLTTKNGTYKNSCDVTVQILKTLSQVEVEQTVETTVVTDEVVVDNGNTVYYGDAEYSYDYSYTELEEAPIPTDEYIPTGEFVDEYNDSYPTANVVEETPTVTEQTNVGNFESTISTNPLVNIANVIKANNVLRSAWKGVNSAPSDMINAIKPTNGVVNYNVVVLNNELGLAKLTVTSAVDYNDYEFTVEVNNGCAVIGEGKQFVGANAQGREFSSWVLRVATFEVARTTLK